MTADRGASRHGKQEDIEQSDALPEPLLPQQPTDPKRPFPLRAAPERTSDPSDWDVDGGEVARPTPWAESPGVGLDPARDLERLSPEWAAPESAYSTELQQGAVHPQTTEGDDHRGEPDGVSERG